MTSVAKGAGVLLLNWTCILTATLPRCVVGKIDKQPGVHMTDHGDWHVRCSPSHLGHSHRSRGRNVREKSMVLILVRSVPRRLLT